MSADGFTPSRRYVPPRRFDHDVILDRWLAGDSSGMIGSALGMSDVSVRDVIAEYRRKGDPRAIAHPSVPSSAWTNGMVERLKLLWAEGRSAAEIATTFGMTRNAIIGKVHRLDLPMRMIKRGIGLKRKPISDKRPCLTPEERAARAAERMRRFRARTEAKPHQQRPQPRRELIPAPDTMRLMSILDLEGQNCRFPIGDPKQDGFSSCGNDKDPAGSSYCAFHRQLAYQPIESLRSRNNNTNYMARRYG